MVGATLALVLAASDVTVWQRAAGDYTADIPPKRLLEQKVSIAPSETKELFDVQYNKRGIYRGLPLSRVLAPFKANRAVDTALLHFANGMIVPVALASSLVQELFIAVERKDEQGRLVGKFDDVRKDDNYYQDNRPLTFSTNKVVSTTLEHPSLRTKSGNLFSPWRHVDSLVGIELVQQTAYLAQFDVDPLAAAGFARFTERCQFCHGARRVGASYGWDYVRPVALHTYRTPKSLFFHVKHREGDAAEKGIMMPGLADVTEKDAADLWQLMRSLAENKLRAYEPNATKQ